MIIAKSPKPTTIDLPDHTQLPESDGTFVFAERAVGKNFQEHPQSVLLTDSIRPVLQQLHPDGQYRIGQDCGIYWRLTEPPEKGAEAPDWFYVPHIPPLLDGEMRRSYVLWKEYVAPLIVLEFVSGDGSEERDKTPPSLNDQEEKQKAGKFWVYEQAIRVPFYGIYEVKNASVEMYQLVEGRYELLSSNERGHYPIPSMGVELGIWEGEYDEVTLPWLRWWDNQGNLLLTGDERSQLLTSQLEQERQRTEQEQQRAEQERQRAERLAERLRQMGIDPNEL
ncbi:MAG: Uma2 family endonuclease [Symploca sp. SIO2D2]|nr:Uma2 family endonuclease [Symploca sp. SIO2D2]